MAYQKVLLVDDEVEFIETLSERMQVRGLTVDTATTGEDAIKLVGENYYDAIILDLNMPGLDGIETLKRIREQSPDSQIILLTGYATVEKSVEAVKHGAVDFLEKPADLDKLMSIIKEASDKKMMLYEKRAEDDIKKIMKSKGW
ncbi:MAG: response regulator [bacterium]|nr:response regulator [bacterium]